MSRLESYKHDKDEKEGPFPHKLCRNDLIREYRISSRWIACDTHKRVQE